MVIRNGASDTLKARWGLWVVGSSLARLPGVGHGGALRERVKRLQDIPGVRPRGPFLVVDVGDHRQADEQRGLVRIVVGQLHANRQPLDDLHEVAGGVLRREQGERLAGPHGEAGDAALVLAPAPVHVDLAAHPMADAQVRELSLLEVAIDPDLGERADGHQALPHRDVVSGVDVAAGHHAVDLADDVAVAEVQQGLIQVGAGLEELGLGLLDGRRVRDEVFEDAVEIPAGIPLAEVSQELAWSHVLADQVQADLGRGLDQVVQRRPDCGEGLFEIRRDLGQVVPVGRLGGKAEVDPARVDLLQGLLDGRLIHLDRLPAHVEIFLADAPARYELLAPFEVGLRQRQGRLLALVSRHVGSKRGDLVVHLLHGRLQLPTLGSADRLQSAHLGFGGHQVRFGGSDGGSLDRDLNLVGLLVELDQQVPPLHAVVVVHQAPGSPGRRPGEPRRSRGR